MVIGAAESWATTSSSARAQTSIRRHSLNPCAAHGFYRARDARLRVRESFRVPVHSGPEDLGSARYAFHPISTEKMSLRALHGLALTTCSGKRCLERPRGDQKQNLGGRLSPVTEPILSHRHKRQPRRFRIPESAVESLA